MTSFSRRAALVSGIVGLIVIGGGYLLTQRDGGATKQLQAPELSSAAKEKLHKLDLGRAFHVARLSAADNDPVRVVELANEWVKRGKLTGDGADFDSALDLLDKGERAVGRPTPLIPAARAHALWARHRFVECRQIAEKAVKLFVDDEPLLALAADCSEYSGDTTAGKEGFEKLSEVNERISVPWIGLAYHYEIAGDLEKSLELLNKAMNAGYPQPLGYERQAYVHSVMGDVYAKQGDQKSAKLQYKWALLKQPDYAQALNGLADVAQWEGDDVEAEKLLRGLIENEAPKADYQIKLADLLDRHGKKEEATATRAEAEKYYEWSVSTGYDGYLRPLVALKLAEGDYRRAAELAMRDLEIRPTTESKAIYQNVFAQAKAAGKPINETALRKIVSKPLTAVEKS